VVLGGKWNDNAGSYGLAVGAIPSKSVPDFVDALVNHYVEQRERNETFQAWIQRLGKKAVKDMIDPFTAIPEYEEDPSYYRDWGDSREYGIQDIGVGECAGEVVSLFSMQITKAEAEHFNALIALDEKNFVLADQKAYEAMLLAARSLVLIQTLNVGNDPDRIVTEFRKRFYDTEMFFDKYARGKFAQPLFRRHETAPVNPTEDEAHRLIDEAQLFIEACHAAEARINGVITS
jgi:sulfite reductase (ferredoxin)